MVLNPVRQDSRLDLAAAAAAAGLSDRCHCELEIPGENSTRSRHLPYLDLTRMMSG